MSIITICCKHDVAKETFVDTRIPPITNDWLDASSLDIHKLFDKFNKLLFWGKLNNVKLEWSNKMTISAGICYSRPSQKYHCVRLSRPLLSQRPHSDLVDTLLHEMIHAYLFVTRTRDNESHGVKFHEHMNRINKAVGTNISVYHTFHKEVRSLKRHWWRCDGPCRNSEPNYGWVKKAVNRAPGPWDATWRNHESRCGGRFVKVQEPIEYTKKRIKGLFDDGISLQNTRLCLNNFVFEKIDSGDCDGLQVNLGSGHESHRFNDRPFCRRISKEDLSNHLKACDKIKKLFESNQVDSGGKSSEDIDVDLTKCPFCDKYLFKDSIKDHLEICDGLQDALDKENMSKTDVIRCPFCYRAVKDKFSLQTGGFFVKGTGVDDESDFSIGRKWDRKQQVSSEVKDEVKIKVEYDSTIDIFTDHPVCSRKIPKEVLSNQLTGCDKIKSLLGADGFSSGEKCAWEIDVNFTKCSLCGKYLFIDSVKKHLEKCDGLQSVHDRGNMGETTVVCCPFSRKVVQGEFSEQTGSNLSKDIGSDDESDFPTVRKWDGKREIDSGENDELQMNFESDSTSNLFVDRPVHSKKLLKKVLSDHLELCDKIKRLFGADRVGSGEKCSGDIGVDLIKCHLCDKYLFEDSVKDHLEICDDLQSVLGGENSSGTIIYCPFCCRAVDGELPLKTGVFFSKDSGHYDSDYTTRRKWDGKQQMSSEVKDEVQIKAESDATIDIFADQPVCSRKIPKEVSSDQLTGCENIKSLPGADEFSSGGKCSWEIDDNFTKCSICDKYLFKDSVKKHLDVCNGLQGVLDSEKMGSEVNDELQANIQSTSMSDISVARPVCSRRIPKEMLNHLKVCDKIKRLFGVDRIASEGKCSGEIDVDLTKCPLCDKYLFKDNVKYHLETCNGLQSVLDRKNLGETTFVYCTFCSKAVQGELSLQTGDCLSKVASVEDDRIYLCVDVEGINDQIGPKDDSDIENYVEKVRETKEKERVEKCLVCDNVLGDISLRSHLEKCDGLQNIFDDDIITLDEDRSSEESKQHFVERYPVSAITQFGTNPNIAGRNHALYVER